MSGLLRFPPPPPPPPRSGVCMCVWACVFTGSQRFICICVWTDSSSLDCAGKSTPEFIITAIIIITGGQQAVSCWAAWLVHSTGTEKSYCPACEGNEGGGLPASLQAIACKFGQHCYCLKFLTVRLCHAHDTAHSVSLWFFFFLNRAGFVRTGTFFQCDKAFK